MSARTASFLLVVVALSILGCGGGAKTAAVSPASEGDAAFKQVGGGDGGAAGGQPAGVDAKAVKAASTPAERKIVTRATLEVIVTNLDEVVPQVEKLVAEQKGAYIAKSEVRGNTEARRTATFTLRVPADVFPAVRERLRGFGIPDRDANDSEDVTEEYVDVQARIKNLKEQEDKLNELLKEKRKEEKLDDIIKVSDRIAEVRANVERVQGRLNYLANMTSLATINLTLKEIKDYQPPTAPTFRNRVGSAFESSWEALVWLAEGVALFAVRLTPWLPIVVPAVIVLVWAVRRVLRESKPTPPDGGTDAPPTGDGPTA